MNNSKELCNMNRSVFHCPAIFLVGDTAVCHQRQDQHVICLKCGTLMTNQVGSTNTI